MFVAPEYFWSMRLHKYVVYYVSMYENDESSGESSRAASSLGLVLDSSSFVPYYEQIVQQVRTLIQRGTAWAATGNVE